MIDMKLTGARICDLRKQADMTQLELADLLNVSYQAVSSWERGITMPDIGKLPEIANIFNTTIDNIVCDTQQARIIESTIKGEQEPNDINAESILSVAPVLKPKQVDKLTSGIKFNINELLGIAPFISRDVLNGLARKAVDCGSINDLTGIAPFVSRDVLDELARNTAECGSISELTCIAPFISRGVLDELAKNAASIGNINELSGIAPFLSKGTLNEIVITMMSGDKDEPAGELFYMK